MKEIINKVIPAVVTGLILGMIGTFGQIKDNTIELKKMGQELEEIEAKHTKRLENLEHSREMMPDYYVTRREFNLVIQTLDERMQKVDRNVEKLLDMQIRNKKD